MKYRIDELAKEYIKSFEILNFDIDRPYLPEFNFDAYNDNEYLNCIKGINEEFDKVDDIFITDEFITQNSYDDKQK